MSGSEQYKNIDLNLESFMAYVFDKDGKIADPPGCDTAFYLSKMERFDMRETEKTEMVHRLWNAVESVIRMQFGFDSLTHIMNEKAQMRAQNDLVMVQSKLIQHEQSDEGA